MNDATSVANLISIFFSNFGFTMLVVALLLSVIQILIQKRRARKAEIIFRYVAFFALGLTGLYTGFFHAFYPETTAANIGWPTSPFQWEVAMADFALGFLGIFAVKASQGFRIAVVLATAVILWGDALGHFYQFIRYQNFAPGNVGSWLWVDILVPFILLIALTQLKDNRRLFA